MEKIRGRLIKKYPVKLINDTLYVWLQDNRVLKIRRWRWDKSGSIYVKYTIQHNGKLMFVIKLEIANTDTVDNLWKTTVKIS